MHRATVAALVIVTAALAAGCGLLPGVPYVGTIKTCDPDIEAVLCRRIAETAFRAYAGPALVADDIDVGTWDSCRNDQVLGKAPAARGGTTCWSVGATAAAGGEHVGDSVYKGGTIVAVDAVVWAMPDGSLHAVTTGENLIPVPQATP